VSNVNKLSYVFANKKNVLDHSSLNKVV